ncbi:MAG: GAF domain-containing protein [bacterium]|nr:GAF domain-containing protein [bacterium]
MIGEVRIPLLQLNYPYGDPLIRQRAQALLYMIAIVALGWAILLVITLSQVADEIYEPGFIIPTIVAPISYVFIYRLVQTGQAQLASLLFVSLMLIGTAPVAIISPELFLSFLLIIPLVAAGALFNRLGFLVVLAVILVALLTRAFVLLNVDTVIRYIPSVNGAGEIALAGLVIVIAAVFLFGFTGGTERIAQSSLNDLHHWELFARLNLRGETDPDRIAQRLIDLLQAELDYNLVQIYFADETGSITRRVRSGGAVDRQFRVRIDELPTIGEVAREKRLRVFRRDSSTLREYPLAPSRIGIALPILYNGIVLGILDVQTRRADAPSENQINALSALADALAELLINARRQTELQKTVADQEGVIATFRTRLTELQQRGAQLVGGNWMRYLEGRGGQAFGFDVADHTPGGTDGDFGRGDRTPEGKAVPRPAHDLPPAIREVLQRGDLFIEPGADGTSVVHVPILLREEVLGGMMFTLPPERPLTDRQIEALRAISNRLGQSLENNRLFEQSQAQAQRERKASEISARLLSATTIENLLDLAVMNFNDALGAISTRVYIQPDFVQPDTFRPDAPDPAHPPTRSGNGNGNGAASHGANGA